MSARKNDLGPIIARFDTKNAGPEGQSNVRGHINDTYMIAGGQGSPGYVLQKINRTVFSDPESVMKNIKRVLDHLGTKEPDPRRRLTLVPARDGRAFWKDPEGEYWRMYELIGGSTSIDRAKTPEQAYEAAKAFGDFQRLLADLPGKSLFETIPRFHDTPKRLADLERAVRQDKKRRAGDAREEIAFALGRRRLAGCLEGLKTDAARLRITHNDTKVNNILFDSASGKALAVVDLDTVMPGLSLYDFGDLVRNSVGGADEDETDLSRISVNLPLFKALARGFIDGALGMIDPAEKERLAASGRVMALELGMRFLSDHLSGDTYFRTQHPGHNLERARNQFRLVEVLEEKNEELNRIIAAI